MTQNWARPPFPFRFSTSGIRLERMTLGILFLVLTGFVWVSVGAAIGHVERSGLSLVRYQILSCAASVTFGLAGWAAAPGAFFPQSPCPRSTWALVVAGTFLCGVFNYLMIVELGRAMREGPNSIVWAVVQSGLVYPFLMGWLVFGVTMTPMRFLGIVLIVASVFLYATRGGAVGTSAPLRRWLPAALLGMFFCGVNQCGANLPSYLEGGKDFSGTFRSFSLHFGLLAASLVHVGIRKLRGDGLEPARPGEYRGLALWSFGVGAASFLVGKYLTFPGLDRLEQSGAGAMGYPVAVAACIAGFFPYGVFVLRERVSARQALGAVLGIAGILLGCL
ncbi:MAG: hypothetical protein IJ678_00810 [Kiritimatiellae bacterium]|nr:hypothetical protein [Kiritimatiellia bacterium]